MKIEVLMFAAARDLLGHESVEVELDDDATVGQLKQAIAARFPESDDLVQRSAFSVNQQYAIDSTPLDSNAEVAMIPPVSGG